MKCASVSWCGQGRAGAPTTPARRDPKSEVSQGCPAPEIKSYFISECTSPTWGGFLCWWFFGGSFFSLPSQCFLDAN